MQIPILRREIPAVFIMSAALLVGAAAARPLVAGIEPGWLGDRLVASAKAACPQALGADPIRTFDDVGGVADRWAWRSAHDYVTGRNGPRALCRPADRLGRQAHAVGGKG